METLFHIFSLDLTKLNRLKALDVTVVSSLQKELKKIAAAELGNSFPYFSRS
jgi:hypothetical protein